ncbi:hypothetical protein ACSNN9_28705, partial [Micromonospora sp. URMC 107]
MCALVGMGLGALTRHAAGAVAAATTVLLLAPMLIDSDEHRWMAELHDALPLAAWLRLIEVHPDVLNPDPFPTTVTGAWLTLAAWSLTATLTAITLTH